MLKSIKNDIIAIIDKYLGGDYLLFIFGSSAGNKSNRSSDIDIAVYRDKNIPAKIAVEMREELNEKARTLREIDLINLTDDGINSGLLENILRKGVIWKRPKNSKELLKNLQRRLTNIKK